MHDRLTAYLSVSAFYPIKFFSHFLSACASARLVINRKHTRSFRSFTDLSFSKSLIVNSVLI